MDLDGLNLHEQVYSSAAGKTSHYLVQSRVAAGVWELALWLRPEAQEPNNLCAWAGIGEDTSNPAELRHAMLQGMMSVEPRPNGGRKLTIHLGDRRKNSVYLDPLPVADALGQLFDGCLALLARPEKDNSEKLQAELDAANIHTLTQRLRDEKASAARDGRNGPQTPPKKAPPKGASQLQPYQKRRKRQENEFADSESDDDDDDDDSEDESGGE